MTTALLSPVSGSKGSHLHPFSILAAGAALLAVLMLIGGAGHGLAVVGVHLRAERSYDFRFAALLTNGAILAYAGLTHLVLLKWIAEGRPWALAWSAAVTLAVVVYAILLLPVATARGGAVPVLLLNVGYLVCLGAFWRHSAALERW